MPNVWVMGSGTSMTKEDEKQQRDRAESIRRQIEELKSGKKAPTRPDKPANPREFIDKQTNPEKGCKKED